VHTLLSSNVMMIPPIAPGVTTGGSRRPPIYRKSRLIAIIRRPLAGSLASRLWFRENCRNQKELTPVPSQTAALPQTRSARHLRKQLFCKQAIICRGQVFSIGRPRYCCSPAKSEFFTITTATFPCFEALDHR
jgi:hypothetical protein